MKVALAHDYFTQRGGAERVAIDIARAFPGAPMYTTLVDSAGTFPEVAGLDVRPSALNRFGVFRRRHRWALPLLARDVDRIRVDADVLVASSSGWAHGIRTTGALVVYCHTPAHWLWTTDAYVADSRLQRAAVNLLGPRLRRWDIAAAARADRYLVNSTTSRDRVSEAYGIEAEVLPAPPALGPDGPMRAPEVRRGRDDAPFVLCVARLLPYKNVDAVIDGVLSHGDLDLVVVGSGPDLGRLRSRAAGSPRVTFAGRVDDAELRWLYANARALVAASYEDYGLTPIEAAMFGTPTAALRAGGFLDTVVEETGVFFDAPGAGEIAEALERVESRDWDATAITRHAERFGWDHFAARLREVVDDVAR